ncbi:MAG: response regulator [Betaproteobacteria bacterium]
MSARCGELRRILYVEDDESIRAVGLLVLQGVGGFEVIACASGEEAIALAPGARADLILLDVNMPGLDGRETLARLRALAQTATTPVVFLTATQQADDVSGLLAMGAVDVIGKPFEPMSLPDRLREIWAGATAAGKKAG